MTLRLVIASNNPKKRREIETILAGLGIEFVPADDTYFVEVVEDADSFAGNAEKKARAFAEANGCAAIADDSGLCVEALGGAPGVRSSRYAGEHATDAENNARLLRDLAGVQDRRAHFFCAVHLAFADDRPGIRAEGRTDGRILNEPDGEEGFGYDPLFYSDDLHMSFARADAEAKASVSHRGRALRELARKLAALD